VLNLVLGLDDDEVGGRDVAGRELLEARLEGRARHPWFATPDTRVDPDGLTRARA
jgi:hypothetical protein